MRARIKGGKAVLSALGLSMIATVAACSTTPTEQVGEVRPAVGFLPEPGLLRPGEAGQARLMYINPTADFSSYTKAMVDPIAVWTKPGSRWVQLPEQQRKALADMFQTDLRDAIAQRCDIVRTPGPGTVRFRLALTDAEESDAAANTIATYVPQARMLDTLAGYAFNDGTGNFVGAASAEGYATDAADGTLLWQGVDRRAGANAIGSDTFGSWDDVRNAFRAWSAQFTTRMAELGMCPR